MLLESMMSMSLISMEEPSMSLLTIEEPEAQGIFEVNITCDIHKALTGWSLLPSTEPAHTRLLAVHTMLNTGWPTPLLSVLSFLLNMNLSDSLFRDMLSTLQLLTCAVRCLTLPMPHGTFFTTLVKAALPLHIIVVLDELPDTDNA
jgi:hypothetical protein